MALSSNWLSLTDLGRIYGISDIQCGRALQQQGWRDHQGRPTPHALKSGAAHAVNPNTPPKTNVWNSEICKTYLEGKGYQPVSRSVQVEQWVALLEALEAGSPSIASTPEQMAEELPKELINEVNNQLAQRGCLFRAREAKCCA